MSQFKLLQKKVLSLFWVFLFSTNFLLADFSSRWEDFPDQVWVGSELWANRLQDWRINNRRLECINTNPRKPVRTVHLLTHRMESNTGGFEMEVLTGALSNSIDNISENASVGFLIAAGKGLDYRASALIHHTCGKNGGILAGINGRGHLFYSDFSTKKKEGVRDVGKILAVSEKRLRSLEQVELQLNGEIKNGRYKLVLTAFSKLDESKAVSVVLPGIPKEDLVGNVGLFSNPGSSPGNTKFWFKHWFVKGDKFSVNAQRKCSPIFSAAYTLDNKTLNLSAQMMPVSLKCGKKLELQLKTDTGWECVDVSNIETPGYVAKFTVRNWQINKDVPYRITYDLEKRTGDIKECSYEGKIRQVPYNKDEMVVAAFTGNHNVERPGIDRSPTDWTFEQIWFPHNDLVSSVKKQSPDLLFFSGDQVYETASPTVADIFSSLRNMELDYLYKWYLWCWTYRDLCRDIPAIIIPDDHDVYQGNLWGAGGRHTEDQGDGGYVRPPEFVNMVQRTQTSNLPKPYDPTPIKQGIGVYYTSVNYAGVSFAVIEDRKFKSSARSLFPEQMVGETGFSTKGGFDPKVDTDIEQAKLLGERQLEFLENWAVDYSDGVWAKVLLSQTLFNHLQTYPRGYSNKSKDFLLKNDDYPKNDKFTTNTDSGGWPQTGRNSAIKMIRRGFAVHIAGDTHLGCTVQYGVDRWKDSPFVMCVPSVANFWPRRWCPPYPGEDRKPDAPRYTGNYEDSFGNLMTVYAVSNPRVSNRKPETLYDRAAGYGIAKLNRETRDIEFSLWPRWVNPSDPYASPYRGWPVKFNQMDNYNFANTSYLPELQVSGMLNPVVWVIDETSDKLLYTVRISGNSFTPKVPYLDAGYTIKIGEPGTEQIKVYTGIKAENVKENNKLLVRF